MNPPDLTLELDATLPSARTARLAVERHLRDAGLDAEVAMLLVSELVTNAVMHTDSATIGVELCMLAPRLVRVEVTNEGAGEPRLVTAPAQRVGGRGLQLVDQVSERWGYDDSASQTRVWFELELVDA